MFDIEFGVRCGLVEVYGPRLVMGFPGNGLEMAQFSANSTFFWQLSRRKLKRKKNGFTEGFAPCFHETICTWSPRGVLANEILRLFLPRTVHDFRIFVKFSKSREMLLLY